MSSTVGSKSKSGSKIMAPRPLRTSSHTAPTPTSSPMIGLDTCMILEDILQHPEEQHQWDDDSVLGGESDNESGDSAESELQMIFGGGLGSSSASFAAYDDTEYSGSLYDSDDFGTYLSSIESKNPRFDSFPVLGASPAPILGNHQSGQSSGGYGVPSRARNPLAQEMLKKKQQQQQAMLQEKYYENKMAAVKNSNASASAVHHLIVSLSATSPPPRHRSYSEPIPFGAGSRTEVGSYG